MTTELCYVCRELVDCADLEAIHVATKHTKTSISVLIQKLLGDDRPTQFEANDSICSRCLHKFNQYDLARLTVQQVEAELKRVLLNTPVCVKQEVTDYPELDAELEVRYQHDNVNGSTVPETTQREENDDISEDEQIVYLVVDEESGESGPEEDNQVENTISGNEEPGESDSRGQHGLPTWLENIDGNELEAYCKICERKVVASETFLIAHEKSRGHIRTMSDRRKGSLSTSLDRKNKSSTIKSVRRVPRSGSIYQSPGGQIIFYCDVCYHEAPNADDLAEHIALHDKKLKCPVCASVRKTKRGLMYHMQSHEQYQGDESLAVKPKRNVCLICGKDALPKYLLSQHMKTHQTLIGNLTQSSRGLRILRCDFCNHEEQNADDLIAHFTLHGNQSKCVICAKEFQRKEALKLHMAMHSDQKHYQCDKCGLVFIRKNSLESHLETTHTVERTVHCSLCPMSFKAKSGLRTHMLTHNAEKKHACPECGKCFLVGWNMRAHYNAVHLGISSRSKRHLCVICNTTFERPSQLKQHCIKIHSRVTTEDTCRSENA